MGDRYHRIQGWRTKTVPVFGSAKHPDCRGITVDELQKIQFDRLDFTNFYEDLMNNQKIPDSGVLTQKVKEQIADQLKQAGQ